MFRAFLDESYNSRVFIISGFAADTTVWPSIEAQWNRAIKRKHLKRCHAVDCFHGKEEFKDWPREGREELTAELSRILTHRRPSSSKIREGIYGVTYATDRQGYRDLMKGSPYPDEYMLLLQLMIRRLAALCQALPSTERIDVVMDRNASFTGKATEQFERLAEDPCVEHR